MSRRIMKVWKNRETFLYCSNSKSFAVMEAPFTHITGSGEVECIWEIDVEQTGNYKVGFGCCVSGAYAEATAYSRNRQISTTFQKTKGFFRNQTLNFAHEEADDLLYLEEGAQEIRIRIRDKDGQSVAVSSVSLCPESYLEKRYQEKKEAAGMRQEAWYKQGAYGMMFHWTGESCPMEGDKLDYEKAVDAFDTEKFADMVAETGASYVLFTMNHAIAHFPAPIEEWEAYYPGMTTGRDLVEDLYRALSARGIELLLYLNFTAAYAESPRCGLQKEDGGYRNIIELSPEKREDYTEVAVRLLEAIGKRYGVKVKGYWIDSCYQLPQQFGTMDFKKLYLAGKTGYGKRMVTFNHWILPVMTPWNDCWAGESAGMIEVPDKNLPAYGPAPGIPLHDLMIMEDDWGFFNRTGRIPDTAHTPEEMLEYVTKFVKSKSMLTINAEIYQEGTLGEQTRKVLRQMAKMAAAGTAL